MLIFIASFLIIILSIFNQKNIISKKTSFLSKFKRRFKNRNRLREKISEEFSNSLLLDPEYNITIGSWYSEQELREKADIHRARLSKYGRSKMNGEMLYLGPKGGIYKYNSLGKKIYL